MQSGRRRPDRRRPATVLGVVVPLAALALSGCAAGALAETGDVGSRPIRVTTTTNWHTDLASRIGGDRVEVTGLMGPGVDPHLYEAGAGDVQTLAGSDIVIWNGLDLEGKLEEVFTGIGRSVPVVAVGDAVPEEQLIAVGEGEHDPHIWFDPDLWALAAEAVRDGLAELDPGSADVYEANLAEFTAELEALEAEVGALVAQVPERSRVLVTSHDAFSYLARAYGLQVAPVQGRSTAAEATTADVERVARTVAEADLSAVFLESSVPPQTISAVLAAAEQQGRPTEVGGELHGDALGSPGTPTGDYAGAVRHNARAIAEGLTR
ncbi:metal ABC transporter solute-binding protein, Zn/Mn family [Geodermatophilus sp. SYSU D00758]